MGIDTTKLWGEQKQPADCLTATVTNTVHLTMSRVTNACRPVLCCTMSSRGPIFNSNTHVHTRTHTLLPVPVPDQTKDARWSCDCGEQWKGNKKINLYSTVCYTFYLRSHLPHHSLVCAVGPDSNTGDKYKQLRPGIGSISVTHWSLALNPNQCIIWSQSMALRWDSG